MAKENIDNIPKLIKHLNFIAPQHVIPAVRLLFSKAVTESTDTFKQELWNSITHYVSLMSRREDISKSENRYIKSTLKKVQKKLFPKKITLSS